MYISIYYLILYNIYISIYFGVYFDIYFTICQHILQYFSVFDLTDFNDFSCILMYVSAILAGDVAWAQKIGRIA